MEKFTLSEEELSELHAARLFAKRNKDVNSAYRIHAIILLGTGMTREEVSEVLFINIDTLSTYVKKYKSNGVKGLCQTYYMGCPRKLSDEQIERLMQELDNNIHLTTQSIVEFVKTKFKINYTQSGMCDLLHRLGYEYKKPKLVPGNPDVDAQEEFIKHYEDFMLSKPADAEVLFMDAVHPEHNTMASYGWIKRGEKKELKTNCGRQRLNLHGIINAETHEVTIIESDRVNKDSTLQLLELVERKYFMASMIYIILDNAGYHYSKEVKSFLKGKNIQLVFLPAYSPNLNLIERLWKFFKKKVLYNKYYENVKEFRKACIRFFKNIAQHSDEVANFMDADFEMA